MRFFRSPQPPPSIWSVVPFAFSRTVKEHFLLLISDPEQKVTYKITIGELRKYLNGDDW